jgi:CrcB protein
MKIILAIGTGSFIGGILRYLFSQSVQSRFLSSFPYGTLAVNIIGCFLIGIVFGISERGNMSNEWRLFLATGLLGGFTTFSAFSNETVGLLRDGQFFYASAYILSSVALALVATFLGVSMIKLF